MLLPAPLQAPGSAAREAAGGAWVLLKLGKALGRAGPAHIQTFEVFDFWASHALGFQTVKPFQEQFEMCL